MSNKDLKLIFLIESIFKTFGRIRLKITDRWPEDPTAIGISDIAEQFLIYISCNCEDEKKFFVALEYPSKDADLPYSPGKEFDNIEEEEINALIRSHILQQQ